jgi:hypothetical protein
MKYYDGQNEDIWSYRETSHRALMGAIAFGAIVSGVAALFAGDNLIEKLPLLLLFVLMSGLLIWHVKRITTVVISRKDGTVRKDERSVIFSRCRTYSLRDFNAIALAEHVRTGEEGYLTADYSLVLQGPGHSLTILSTNDGEEATRLQHELKSYLESGPENGSSPVGR